MIDRGLLDRLRSHSHISHVSKLSILNRQRLVLKDRKVYGLKRLLLSDILDRFRLNLSQSLEMNFQFLQFLFPARKDLGYKVKTDYNNSIRYITRDTLKKIVSNLYVTQELIKENPQLKTLIELRAELLFKDKVVFESKTIEAVLLKELKQLSSIKPAEIEKRLKYFTELNTRLEKIIIKENRGDIKFDITKLTQFNTVETASLIQVFNENKSQQDDEKLMQGLEKKIFIEERNIQNETRLERLFISQIQKKQSTTIITSIYQALKRVFPLLKEDKTVQRIFQEQLETIFLDKTLSKNEVLSECIRIKEAFVSEITNTYETYIHTMDEKEIEVSLLQQLIKESRTEHHSFEIKDRMQKQVKAFVKKYYGSKSLLEYHVFLKEMSTTLLSKNDTRLSIMDKIKHYTSVKEGLYEKISVYKKQMGKDTFHSIVHERFLNEQSYKLLSNKQKERVSRIIQEKLNQREHGKVVSSREVQVLKQELQKASIPIIKLIDKTVLHEIIQKQTSNEIKEIEIRLQDLKVTHEKELSKSFYNELVSTEKSQFMSPKKKVLLRESINKILKKSFVQGLDIENELIQMKTSFLQLPQITMIEKRDEGLKTQHELQKFYLHLVKEVQEHTLKRQLSFIQKKVALSKIAKVLRYKTSVLKEKEFYKMTQEFIVLQTGSNKSFLDARHTSFMQRRDEKLKGEKELEQFYKYFIKEIQAHNSSGQLSLIQKKSVLSTINKVLNYKHSYLREKEMQKIIQAFVSAKKVSDKSEESKMHALREKGMPIKIPQLIRSLQGTSKLGVLGKSTLLRQVNQEKILENLHITNLSQKSSAYQGEQSLNQEELSLISGVKSFHDEVQSSDRQSVFVGDKQSRLKLTQKVKEEQNILHRQSIMYEIKQQGIQINKELSSVHDDLDERLDEIALKIFRSIKDEISLEYKRL